MNGKLFDELTSTYKGERLREKQREKDRDAFWKKMEALELNPPAEGKEVTPSLFPEKLTDYLKKVRVDFWRNLRKMAFEIAKNFTSGKWKNSKIFVK